MQNSVRSSIWKIVTVLFFLIVSYHGLKAVFLPGFSVDNDDLYFAISLFLMIIAGLPALHYSSKMHSFISQNPELQSSFATFMTKKIWYLFIFGWRIYILYYVYKLSNSDELKKLANYSIIAYICWLPIVALFFYMFFTIFFRR